MSLITPSLDYTDRDFYSLRLRLQGLIRSVFPDWTDFNTATFGNILLELYAFVGDTLHFYQDGQAAVLKHFIYGGVGLKDVFGRADDLIGIGFGWGEPANKSLFVTDQKSLEAFYRVHLSKELSATAGMTYIKDPPLNLTEDEVTVFSIRGRIDL